ncbi:MFS transporter [Streptomyces sp. NPDC008163]|uniref:MFS transporter n=1 Tax=Streptomyces sp. NPDC008163 TaxID=3364818 RepID=UPI0036EF9C86
MRTFLVLWCGQFASLIGSALTSFALGVWVFQQTGSVTGLGLVYLLTFLPGILVAPFTGALVDRWDRRKPLLLSVGGGVACTLVLATLYATDLLQPWHIYVTSAVTSVLTALQLPAFTATVSLLVPRAQLGRANGMVLFAQAVSQIVGPFAGGFLIAAVDLQGVVLVDCLSFALALGCLLTIRLPRPKATLEGSAGSGSLLGETAQSWRYITRRPGLLWLLVFYAVLNFAVGFVDVLITPLVLSFSETGALGTVMAVGGVGMVLGSVLMSVWGGPRRRIHGVLGFSLLLGLALTLGSLRANLVLIAGAAFVFLFCSAVINASSRSIWQTKVEPDMQGRVIALENMVATSSLPVAYLLAGPLTDHLFQPLMNADGALAHNVGALIGTGAGRGMALLLLGCGMTILLTAVAGYLHPRLRQVEEELPDALPSVPTPEPTTA